MKLMDRLSTKVSKRACAQGAELFEESAVDIVDGDKHGFLAAVNDGDKVYEVDIDCTFKDDIYYSCHCDVFNRERVVCLHVWAALLQAARQGFLSRYERNLFPRLIAMEDDHLPEDEDDEPWELDEDDFEIEVPVDEDYSSLLSGRPLTGASGNPAGEMDDSGPPPWKRVLDSLKLDSLAVEKPPAWPEGRVLNYVIRFESYSADLKIVVEARDPKKNGELGKPKPVSIVQDTAAIVPDPRDREVLQQIVGVPSYHYGPDRTSTFYPSPGKLKLLLPALCATGRCFYSSDLPEKTFFPLQWDPGDPWEFRLDVRLDEPARNHFITGYLQRGEQRISLEEPTVLFKNGLLVRNGYIGPLAYRGSFGWIGLLRKEKSLQVPVAQAQSLMNELLIFPELPGIDLPQEFNISEAKGRPKFAIRIQKTRVGTSAGALAGILFYDYDGFTVQDGESRNVIADKANRRRILRDRKAEAEAKEQLLKAGFRRPGWPIDEWTISARLFPQAVRMLSNTGWQIEAQGKMVRRSGAFKIEVTSGIDWFEMRGSVDFEGTSAPLPALLAAIEKHDGMVLLDDGTYGVLPEEWLKKYSLLTGLGEKEKDHLRFTRGQAGLLDALLAAEPEVSCDEVFEKARRRLREFQGVVPIDPPEGFHGALREYQREGLGWLHFLREFGFGGCLADDMGLGKTVQVLALLESRRQQEASPEGSSARPPSIAIVPRSLIFNWKEEAARFTPGLRILDHTGVGRMKENHQFDGYDLVLTTYGTLRRDAAALKSTPFDYVILDEAQAIKNSDSASAKAVRLLKGNHRLALSGTPVENHLGELWSIFEFLNPGMLGSSSLFKEAKGALRNPEPETRDLLARGLRSFILRRTKAQVATDLPDKVEQTLYCELDKAQRKLYDELRDHYRQQLLKKIDQEGIGRSKIQILEALLRLRQAAIHPGLVDKARVGETSAKLEALLPQLEEVVEEGHKILVFSQFTSMLAILRDRLDKAGTRYAYLDGQTRDRAAVVDQFQNDGNTMLFLISLKAGGLGLNLTAAEYVFLLDPWWNPAVEMQAIDRTHRIGQTRSVFAYRLIARDTVEEKVLELQKSKRDLADAIINADNSLIRDLKQEDLALLLS
jgi:hypothetical protein